MIGAGAAGQEGRREGPDPQAVGQDDARARLEGRHRLLRAVRPDAVPRQARLQPRRLRLHHLHRQLRPADPRGQRRPSTRATSPSSPVLSGNRNFEGRINPDVKMNYLASPPLVVAYALAGSMDIDMLRRAARHRHRRQRRLPARHLAAPTGDRGRHRDRRSTARCSADDYADVFAGDERWQALPTPDGRHVRVGRRLHLRPQAPVLRRHAGRARAGRPTSPAPGCCQARRLRHHRPHLARPARSRRTRPAGKYLAEHGVERRDFNSYGSRRGNHEVMIRGTFANIRLRNQLAPGTEGGFTRDFTGRRRGHHDLRRRR